MPPARPNPPSLRSTRWILFWIVAAGFAFRLVFCGVTQGLNSPPDPALGLDHVQYERIGRYLVEGKGYKMHAWENPSALRPPGMPFFIAGLYTVFGPHYAAVRIALCLLGALTALPLFFIARRIAPEPWALAAAALLAASPGHAYYSTHFFSEPPWTLLMTILICLGARPLEQRGAMGVVGQGLLLGVAALVRPAAFLYPFIWIFLDFVCALLARDSMSRLKRRIALYAVLFVSMMAVILPWSFRNQRVLGEFVLFSTHGGSTFYGAHNERVLNDPDLIGRWVPYEEIPGARDMKHVAGEMDRERESWARGKRFVAEHWADMPRLTFWKFYRLLQVNPETPNRLFNLAVGTSYGLLLPFMLVGLVVLCTRGRCSPAALTLWATLLTLAAHTVLLYGDHRFRISIEPVLILLAVLGAWGILERLRARSAGR